MDRHDAPIVQGTPDEMCQGRFLRNLADARAALITRIMCDPDMPEADAARIMANIGQLEYLEQCSRYLN
jgi:hypothetical protein